jgi:[acyl-carrier-protein] S-malonyltransferase
MGRAWAQASPAAAAVLREADAVLGDRLGAPLSAICFDGPAERLNRTDVSQPAIFACSVASLHGIRERGPLAIASAAGLSLGEYTALHVAGVFDFATGLSLVAERGRLMQEAAESSRGGMVALVGADEDAAAAICAAVTGGAPGAVLVPANYNAPDQIVLSGDAAACDRAVAIAAERDVRATRLAVAGAFHSPHMRPAAERMGAVLARLSLRRPSIEVWSNVTARPHEADPELLKRRLVEQIVSPVRWAQTCRAILDGVLAGAGAGAGAGKGAGRSGDTIEPADSPGGTFIELAPGTVLRGLMRRIDRQAKVVSHDQP